MFNTALEPEWRPAKTKMGMHAHRKLKLLVVDDDPNTRALLQDALEIRGAEVLASASVREAVDAFRTWQPDLLISDIGMPVDDGYELIRPRCAMRRLRRDGARP